MIRLSQNLPAVAKVFALILVLGPGLSMQSLAAGMVQSIEKATVIADGNVAGQPVDIVISFTGSKDHLVPGRTLAAGDQIRVIFPEAFDLANLDPAFPLHDVPWPLPPVPPLPPMPCLPTNLQCTTAVMLQGWPEHPPFPPALFHTLSIDAAENALVITAVQDIAASGPQSPGIKELFLMLHGLTNPEPDEYFIRVEAQTGPGGSWEYGSGIYKVVPNTRPSINVTAVFVKALAGILTGSPACGPGTLPPNPDNPIYQTTGIEEAAPFVWSFLLWGSNNEPLTDVDLRWVNGRRAHLVQGKRVIGQLFLDTPPGASGHDIEVNPYGCPTLLPGAPVIGGTPGIGPQPVGRLDLRFWAGDEPGDYTTTLSINNGNSVRMVVTAE